MPREIDPSLLDPIDEPEEIKEVTGEIVATGQMPAPEEIRLCAPCLEAYIGDLNMVEGTKCQNCLKENVIVYVLKES